MRQIKDLTYIFSMGFQYFRYFFRTPTVHLFKYSIIPRLHYCLNLFAFSSANFPTILLHSWPALVGTNQDFFLATVKLRMLMTVVNRKCLIKTDKKGRHRYIYSTSLNLAEQLLLNPLSDQNKNKHFAFRKLKSNGESRPKKRRPLFYYSIIKRLAE